MKHLERYSIQQSHILAPDNAFCLAKNSVISGESCFTTDTVISYQRLKTQKHLVNSGLSCSGFYLFEHLKRQFTHAVLFIFKTGRCVWVKNYCFFALLGTPSPLKKICISLLTKSLTKIYPPPRILFILVYKSLLCTKNHIFFFRTSWKDGLSKKLRWNMIFLVLSGKMIFLFPKNMILHVGRKMKDDLS